jgi:hypothetical protein
VFASSAHPGFIVVIEQFSLWKLGLQMGLVFKNKTLEIRILSSPPELI